MNDHRRKTDVKSRRLVALIIVSLFGVGILYLPLSSSQVRTSPFVATGHTVQANSSVIGVGQQPKGLLYDQNTGMLYVANYWSRNISIVNPSTDKVVGSIYTGYHVWQLSLDPANGLIYVSNDFISQITVVNPQDRSVVGSINVSPGYYAVGINYDKYNGNFYALCDQTGTVTVINATYNLVQGTINLGGNVGLGNEGVAITPGNDYLYFANYYAGMVSVVNGENNSVVGTIQVGSNPSGTYYDPVNGLVYVTLRGYNASVGNSIVAINPAKGTVVSTLSDFIGPTSLAYDSNQDILAVTNFGSDNISILNASSGTFTGNVTMSQVGNYGTVVIYSNQTGMFYVAVSMANAVVAFNTSAPSSSPVNPPTTTTNTNNGSTSQGGLMGLSPPTVLVVVLAIVAVSAAALVLSRRRSL